jgi:hypothetical protein
MLVSTAETLLAVELAIAHTHSDDFAKFFIEEHGAAVERAIRRKWLADWAADQ